MTGGGRGGDRIGHSVTLGNGRKLKVNGPIPGAMIEEYEYKIISSSAWRGRF